MRLALAGAAVLTLAGCGEPFAPRSAMGRPCPEISAADYAAAIARGATSATASISASGTASITTGPGIVHCATYPGALKPCRRPTDYVIRYALPDGRTVHVMVAAGQQYRFRVGATPTTCEIVGS